MTFVRNGTRDGLRAVQDSPDLGQTEGEGYVHFDSIRIYRIYLFDKDLLLILILA